MGLEILFTPIYGKNTREERRPLWDAIQNLGPQPSLPWIVGGDFNENLSSEERLGTWVYLHGGPSEFKDATNIAHVFELPSIGGEYTWTNNSPGPNFTQSKLDIDFTNQSWIDKWPEVRVEFHNGTSDHKAMIIVFSQAEKWTKPSRLYNSWLEEETFLEAIKEELAKNTRGTN